MVSVGVPEEAVCEIVAASTDSSRAPSTFTLLSVSVIRSASPVLPIWLSVIFTVSTCT